jgi:hypothetical protein
MYAEIVLNEPALVLQVAAFAGGALSCGLVNRLWKDACDRTVRSVRVNARADEDMLRRLLSRPWPLRSIVLDNNQAVTDYVLCILLENFPELQNCAINHCYAVTPAGLQILQEVVGSNVSYRGCWRLLRPSREMSPREVVETQLLAFKHNDPQTADGIIAAYEFASPGNRVVTRSLRDFVQLVTRGYSVLLNFHTHHVADISGGDGTEEATMLVLVEPNAQTHEYSFVWSLSRQPDDAAQYAGCWMTDGVMHAILS